MPDLQRNYDEAQIGELAERLRGTPQSLLDAVGDGPDLTAADHQALDQLVFECEVCGWWCEMSEMLDDRDGVCDDHEGEDE